MKSNFQIKSQDKELHIFIDGIDLIPSSGYPSMPFARFLAYNFWRILYENEIRDDYDFRCAHEIGSIGLGFNWPKIIFMRKDNSIQIITDRKTFLIPIEDFENGIHQFIGQCSQHDKTLKCLWEIVKDDLKNETQKNLRINEAIRGLDPGSLGNQ